MAASDSALRKMKTDSDQRKDFFRILEHVNPPAVKFPPDRANVTHKFIRLIEILDIAPTCGSEFRGLVFGLLLGHLFVTLRLTWLSVRSKAVADALVDLLSLREVKERLNPPDFIQASVYSPVSLIPYFRCTIGLTCSLGIEEGEAVTFEQWHTGQPARRRARSRLRTRPAAV